MTAESTDDIRAKVKAVLINRLQRRPEVPEASAILRAFIDALNQGDPTWIDRLDYDRGAAWARHFIERGEPLPAPLDRFTVEVLTRKRKRSGKGKPAEHGLRDIAIAYAVWLTTEAGLYAYRNEATERESGCDVVADVLREIGAEPTSYAAVADIWRHHPKDGLSRALWREVTDATPYL